jgi:hypothetical protein
MEILDNSLYQKISTKKHNDWDKVSSYMYRNQQDIDQADLDVLYKITSSSLQSILIKSGILLSTSYSLYTHSFPRTAPKMLKALFFCYLSIPFYISADENSKLSSDLQQILIFKYLPPALSKL